MQTCKRLRTLVLSRALRGAHVRRPESAAPAQLGACALLASKPRLTSVQLELTDVDPEALATFGEATARLTALTSLTLDGNRFSLPAVGALAASVRQLRGLQHLSMCSAFLSADGAAFVMLALAALTGLRSLALNGTRINEHAARDLALSLVRLTRLTRLELRAALAPSGGVPEIMRTLASLQLKVVRLGDNVLLHDSVIALAASLRSMRALEQLDLDCCGIEGTAMLRIAESLEGKPHLESLQLCDNHVRDAAVVALAASLRGSCQLTSLALEGAAMRDAGMRALQPILRHNSQLQSLRLACPQLGAGERVLCEAFASGALQQLTEARLALSEAGSVASLLPRLAALSTLQILQLDLRLRAGSSDDVAVHLPRMRALRELSMDVGFRTPRREESALLKAAEQLPELTSIRVWQGRGGLAAVEVNVHQLTALCARRRPGQQFSMSGVCVSGKAMDAALPTILPGLQALRSLDVHWKSDCAADNVVPALGTMSELTALSLVAFQSFPAEIERLTDSLAGLRRLSRLGLIFGSLPGSRDASAATLVRVLHQLPQLSALCLQIDEPPAASAVAAEWCCTQLRELELFVACDGEDDSMDLVSLLQTMGRLTHLRLHCGGDYGMDGSSLAECVAGLSRVQDLSLWLVSGPRGGDATAFRRALQCLPELTQLHVELMDENAEVFDDEDAAARAEAQQFALLTALEGRGGGGNILIG